MKASKQLRDFYKVFSQHGSGDALVCISASEVVLLAYIAYKDVNGYEGDWFLPELTHIANMDFYAIQSEIISKLPNLSIDDAIETLQKCGATSIENVIYLYLRNLCDLYRRRFKFFTILKNQPFPSVNQIGPRCLLEYNNCSSDLLFSWLTWRKWIYDIDNRSAQETGYLFEPILSSCVGGESVSHRYSPIKRIDTDGQVTSEGRQIDCYLADSCEAYEVKLRVTIAASGQGRFKEEMSFPQEAQYAGIIPVLIVFDPTPSVLLDKLKRQYELCGGRYALGEDAWNELSQKAGKEMSVFINKYIKPPITHMEEVNLIATSISLENKESSIIISDNNGNKYTIPRNRDINSIDL